MLNSTPNRALFALLCCTALIAYAAAPCAATPPGPLSRGESVARSLCAACHVVASDQEFSPLLDHPGPSFKEIANRPGTSVASLQKFISTTHWNVDTIPMEMPNPQLGAEDTSAVAHYILSLRKRSKGRP